ncbi:hypothetical protein ANN_11475 [Periplaneta americana]|uniref:Uncharacterized protein n=1 Tax=Periplaneta americana TaxID=6978 RepID=A0ABQ8T6H3_PERAM|nr:hypothetical protein ANN_11475 [Periplaneta americana]
MFIFVVIFAVDNNVRSTERLDAATCTHTLLSTDVHIRTDHVRYTLRYLHCFSVVSCPHPSDNTLNGILKIRNTVINTALLALFDDLGLRAIKFSTTYYCEGGFYVMTNIKTVKRGILKILDEEMRVNLSHIRPNIKYICKIRQAHRLCSAAAKPCFRWCHANISLPVNVAPSSIFDFFPLKFL